MRKPAKGEKVIREELGLDHQEQGLTKKKYSCPRLTEYGDLAKLTLGGGGVQGDSNGTMP